MHPWRVHLSSIRTFTREAVLGDVDALTVVFCAVNGWRLDLPPVAIAGGLMAAVITSAVAAVYPALRAAALAPLEALRSA